MKRVYVHEEWCLGCHLCEYNCAFANSGCADMVKALKAHPDYNVVFFLKDEPKKEYEVVVEKVKTIEDELKDPATAVYDETVTTKGMAVAYIQGNYDDVFTATTVEEMKREAARKWNVIFKNWGK